MNVLSLMQDAEDFDAAGCRSVKIDVRVKRY
jgi:hypothetical protein